MGEVHLPGPGVEVSLRVLQEVPVRAERRELLPHPLNQLLVVGEDRPVANHRVVRVRDVAGLEEAVRHERSDNFHLVAASSRASSLERIARVAFGIVVVPFFAGLSLILVQARSTMGEAQARPKSAPPDVLLVAVILFLALIAAYGLDQ